MLINYHVILTQKAFMTTPLYVIKAINKESVDPDDMTMRHLIRVCTVYHLSYVQT